MGACNTRRMCSLSAVGGLEQIERWMRTYSVVFQADTVIKHRATQIIYKVILRETIFISCLARCEFNTLGTVHGRQNSGARLTPRWKEEERWAGKVMRHDDYNARLSLCGYGGLDRAYGYLYSKIWRTMNIHNSQSPNSHLNFKIEKRNLEIMPLINQESVRPIHLIALSITRTHKAKILHNLICHSIHYCYSNIFPYSTQRPDEILPPYTHDCRRRGNWPVCISPGHELRKEEDGLKWYHGYSSAVLKAWHKV